jgi:hypothetical protein
MELIGKETPTHKYQNETVFVNGYNYRWRKLQKYEIDSTGERFYMIIFGWLDHSLVYNPDEKWVSIDGTKLYCRNTIQAEEYVELFAKANNMKPNWVHLDIVIENIDDLK